MEEAIDIIEDSEDSHEPEKDSSSDYEMHSDSNSESVSDPSDVNGDGGREVDGRNIMHPVSSSYTHIPRFQHKVTHLFLIVTLAPTHTQHRLVATAGECVICPSSSPFAVLAQVAFREE